MQTFDYLNENMVKVLVGHSRTRLTASGQSIDCTKMGRKSKTEDNDADVEEIETRSSSKSKGYNWSAIGIMLMFGIPVVLAGVVQLVDFLYPEAAKLRRTTERVVKCYEVANPSKLSEVDKFVQKYKGREDALFAQLRNKYPKHPECSGR